MYTKMKIVFMILAMVLFFTACGEEDYELVENTTWKPIYESREQLPFDTTSEKASNPFSIYQTVEGKLYLLIQNELCTFSKDTDKKLILKEGVEQFFVGGERIYYARNLTSDGKETSASLYDLYSCDKEGKEDKLIAHNIYSFGVNEEENMLYYFGDLGKDSVRKQNLSTGEMTSLLEKGVLRDLKDEKNVRVCFRKNKIYFADGTSDITEVNLLTGEEDYYTNENFHNPDIQEVYAKGDYLYYAVYDKYCFSNRGDQTGVWERNLKTGKIRNISSQNAAYFYSVNDIVSWQNLNGGNRSDAEERTAAEEKYMENISSEFELPVLKNACMLEGEDTHDGFLGDGETTIRIQLTKENTEELEQAIKNSGKWNICPWKRDSDWEDVTDYITMQKVKKGYYRMLGTDLNGSAVVLDTEKCLFYYYRYDS